MQFQLYQIELVLSQSGGTTIKRGVTEILSEVWVLFFDGKFISSFETSSCAKKQIALLFRKMDSI